MLRAPPKQISPPPLAGNAIPLQLNPDFRRLESVLRMEGEPDRVPFYEHLVDIEVMNAIAGPSIASGTPDGMVDLRLRFYGKLGYDYIPMEIKWPFPRTNFVAGADTAWIPRAQRRWVDQQHGTIESWEDYGRYQFPERGTDFASPVERVSKALPEGTKIITHACGGVLENTMWLMGAKHFVRTLYTDRRLVRSIFDKVGEALVEAFTQASQVKGVGAMCLGDDMGLRTGTMIPPAELMRYVFPWHRKICRAAHSQDLPFILHSCGNLTGVMDCLIDYVGIDAKHSFEDAIMPVAEVKRRWGDRVALLGGIDVDVLARRDVAATAAYVRSVVNSCLPGGSWALGSGNSIPNYVKIDNYLAMLKEGARSGRYRR